MRWIAVFKDTPDMAAVRGSFEPAHLAFLQKNRDEILLAGGLRQEPGGAFVGGLWVFDVASRERAVELIGQDPYTLHGGRTHELHVWGKAFPDVQVVL